MKAVIPQMFNCCNCGRVHVWCAHVRVWLWPRVLQLQGVARHSNSQRLLARPAASTGLHVSVSEVVHCHTLWPLIEEILWLFALLCRNETSQWFRRVSLRSCTWRVSHEDCMFTGVWQIYSLEMDCYSTTVSLLQRLIYCKIIPAMTF